MAMNIKNKDLRLIIARIQAHLKQNTPDNTKVAAALTRIGMLIKARAKLNILKQRPPVKDQGALDNSIDYRFFKEGSVNTIRVGSFGVPYAAMNEFGGPISEKQRRAMFFYMGQKRMKRPPRNPPVITSSNGQLNWRPRPYLVPAIRQTESEMVEIMNSLIGGNNG